MNNIQIRHNILSSIKENIGSGKINIVFTPKGVNSEAFLKKDLRNFLEKNYENCVISFSNGHTTGYDIDLFNSFISSNKKVFVLLNDLSKFEQPIGIINMFYGNKNIDVIATTSLSIKRLSGKNISDIRGRYISYFYPPFLYGDEINDHQDSIAFLFNLYFLNYKHIKIAKKLYFFLLNHVGQILSFRQLYSECGNGISLVTFVGIVNYLHDSGLFYLLTRIELGTFNEMDYGFAFYPTRCFDIFSEDEEVKLNKAQRLKGYYDSLLVAKAFYDNQTIYRAFHIKKETIDEKRINVQLSNCFLIRNKNQYVLVKTDYYSEDDRLLNIFKKYKGNIQKIIVDETDRGFQLNSDGIIECGISFLLKKGIFSYGGI